MGTGADADHGTLEGGQIGQRPFGCVFAGTAGDLAVGAFLAQKAEDRRQRRQSDATVPQTRGIQPGFVELEPGRQDVGNALMQACDEKTADSCVTHTLAGLGRTRHGMKVSFLRPQPARGFRHGR